NRATDALRRLSEAPVESTLGFEAPMWTQGHGLLAKLAIENEADARPGGTAAGAAASAEAHEPGSTVVVYRSPKDPTQALPFPRPPADLALVDPDSGQVRRLAQARTFGSQWLSPDGHRPAYLDLGQAAAAGSTVGMSHDLKVLDLRDGRVNVLVERIEQSFLGGVSWSPDSRWLAYVSRDPSVPHSRREIDVSESPGGNLWLVSADGGEPRGF